MPMFKAEYSTGEGVESSYRLFDSKDEALDWLVGRLFNELGDGDGENGGRGSLRNCENDIRAVLGGFKPYFYADTVWRLYELRDTHVHPVIMGLPRNRYDYEGGMVLYATREEVFFKVVFGTGDNLLAEDRREGYDDYLMLDSYGLMSGVPVSRVFDQLRSGTEIEDVEGLVERDGSQMLVRRGEYGTGDIRAYLENALDMIGYSVHNRDELYCDILYVTEA